MPIQFDPAARARLERAVAVALSGGVQPFAFALGSQMAPLSSAPSVSPAAF